MLTEKIKEQIIEAMKKGNKLRMSTLKLLSSEMHNAQIKKQEDLSEEEELEIVRREAKKRKDAIDAYKKAGADERANKEKEELIILQEYLPKDLTKEEIEKIIDDVITSMRATSMEDMGKVIGAALGKCKGQADGKIVSEIVRTKLS
jgi:uncharacterized protein YqeY